MLVLRTQSPNPPVLDVCEVLRVCKCNPPGEAHSALQTDLTPALSAHFLVSSAIRDFIKISEIYWDLNRNYEVTHDANI